MELDAETFMTWPLPWEAEDDKPAVAGLLEELGFVKGDASACIFRHPVKDIVCSVHGDDFTSSGSQILLD